MFKELQLVFELTPTKIKGGMLISKFFVVILQEKTEV